MSPPEISVVFPVFNEAENIPVLLQEICTAMNGTESYEMIAVNDGSADASLEILRKARKEYPNLRVLSFARNSGQSAALDAGWRAARGRVVVSLDADLQNDPADIPPMLRKLDQEKVDMVIGVRVNRRDSWVKRVQSRIGNSVRNWITRDQITDTGCSLKAVRRECIDRVRLFSGMHRFLPTLVRMEGFQVVEMPVNHRARRHGHSKYGAMNRAFRGLADCLAVRWMSKRTFRYEVKEE